MNPASPSLALFRVDASEQIGAGHLMRCLTLAGALRKSGWRARFVLGAASPALDRLLDGFEVTRLENPAGGAEDAEQIGALAEHLGAAWMVVDHYGLGPEWETTVREHAVKVLAIDDLGRPHRCDMLLDQNYHPDPAARYQGKVPSETRLLLGPRYALLREQFLGAARRATVRSGKVKRLLVSFGGSDPSNETGKVLEALSRLSAPGLEVTVVKRSELLSQAERSLADRLPSVQTVDWVDDMACLMLASDLSFGAGGSTVWERCALGLPSSVVVAAANQLEGATALAQSGAIRLVGVASELTVEDWLREIEFLLAHPETVQATSRCAIELMSREGTAGPQAVVSAMEEMS